MRTRCGRATGWSAALALQGAPRWPGEAAVLAILFLGEAFAGFHAAGIAIILAGVLLSTRPVSS